MMRSETSSQIKKKIHMLFDNALEQNEAVNILEKVDSDPKYSSVYRKQKKASETKTKPCKNDLSIRSGKAL